MRLGATAVIWSAAVVCIGGCGELIDSAPTRVGLDAYAAPLATHAYTVPFARGETESRLRDFTSASTSAGAWVGAGDRALERPTVVDLPFAEWGSFLPSEPNARGFAFVGSEGQVVKVSLARSEPNPSAVLIGDNTHIRAELFLVQVRAGELTHVRLAEIPASGSALWFRLPAGASYVVRLQPEPLTAALYRLSVELEAALPFPVKGRADDAVGSLFGMPRDAGTRHHEGIDIFAPRLTPVVAVADGRATPRENKLGGNTVWLSTPGTSYYYAHLERATVTSGQRVRAGEVIGYIGTSGNAATTDPHLHFGIYRWGKGAIDPFPLLQARRFAQPLIELSASELSAPPLAQASLRRTCASAPRSRNLAGNVYEPGCAMRIGNAIEGASLAEAADCMARQPPPADAAGSRTRPSAFVWQRAAPVGAMPVVPVDFDPAGAVLELPELAEDVDSSASACELASATSASALYASIPRPIGVTAF